MLQLSDDELSIFRGLYAVLGRAPFTAALMLVKCPEICTHITMRPKPSNVRLSYWLRRYREGVEFDGVRLESKKVEKDGQDAWHYRFVPREPTAPQVLTHVDHFGYQKTEVIRGRDGEPIRPAEVAPAPEVYITLKPGPLGAGPDGKIRQPTKAECAARHALTQHGYCGNSTTGSIQPPVYRGEGL
ncbi:MAG TPA: hypothetical protein VHY36_11160 [Steroidobacteraceae bacterium]|jgi:hypothetical protein|nr:hypothetical protein [Steroidobacteraceae bacterium]